MVVGRISLLVLEEAIEDVRQVVGPDALSIVLHSDPDRAVSCFSHKLDVPAGWRVSQGIAHQVTDDLANPVCVHVEQW